LRGIDLPTIFFALGWGFLVCAVANALGIFAGCVPGSWLIRGIVDVGVLVALFLFAMTTIEMIEGTLMYGMGMMTGTSMWTFIGWMLTIGILAIGLLHVFSVAMLSPKTSNRMLIPRLYITACWAALGTAAVIMSFVESNIAWLGSWTMISGIGLMFLTVAALGERDAWSHRVRRKIPRNPLLRMLAFLFYTGSAGGMIWCAMLFAGTIALAYKISGMSFGLPMRTDLHETNTNLSYVFGYVLCYCLTIAALRPLLLRRIPTPSLSVFAAFFGVLVCLVPYLIAFFVERDMWHALPWYMIGSPMVLTTSNELAKGVSPMLIVGWLALGLLASVPWAFGQWRRFIPLDRPKPQPIEAAAVEVVS
jgi:hypothetical protein